MHPSLPRGHLVQIYHDDHFHSLTLEAYIEEGLSQGEGVLLLATKVHWQTVQSQLATSARYPSAIDSGQVRCFDAEEALTHLAAKGRPNRDKFFELVTPLVADFRQKRVRIYGEVVDLLCARGRGEDALILESYWNEFLQSQKNCLLLCGYMDSHLGELDPQSVHRTHCSVIPLEVTSLLSEDAALARRLAQLELKIAERESDSLDLKNQLSHQQRLSLIGELTTGLAHELNNPLAVLINHLSLLRRSFSTLQPAEVERRITRMEVATERIVRAVRNVLRLARHEELQRENTTAQVILQRAHDLTQDILSPLNVALEITDQTGSAVCHVDKDLISQALANLILNAKDAIVSTGRPQGLIQLKARSEGSALMIEVSDNGCGMSPEVQSRIFSPFFTTKPAGQGTGLGLTLAQATVREHGGTLSCHSQQGHGTTFTLSLPVNSP